MRSALITRQYDPNGLTLETVHKYAPSVFATQPHHKVSKQYQFISTVDVLNVLLKKDFKVVGASQSRTRELGREAYTKHQLRLRLPHTGEWRVGDTFPEILLMNAHDRSCCFDTLLGFWRVWCSNGCATQLGTQGGRVKVKHIGHVADVVESVLQIAQQAPVLSQTLNQWSKLLLTRDQRQEFAQAASELRWKSSPHHPSLPILPEQLLLTRRPQDQGDDLFHTYQRVEENLIQGGLPSYAMAVNARTGKRRKQTTRSIQSVNTDTRINIGLWALAEQTAGKIQ